MTESMDRQDDAQRRPLLRRPADDDDNTDGSRMSWARQNQWIVLAVASGACAAFNGVFAKLYVLLRRAVSAAGQTRS